MKLSEWKLKMTDNVQARLSQIHGMADKASLKFMHLQDKVSGLKSKFSEAASEIPGLGQAMNLLKNPIALIAAGVVAVGMLGYKATQMAMSYEEGMAKINATARMTKPELEGLRKELMLVGRDSGGNFARVPESFEKILSQTNDVALSMDIVKASVKGAKAGFTDLDLVAGALSQSMSVIGDKNTKAQDVLDTFTAAKRVGAGEFKDFATYLPTLIAAGKNLGVTYQNTAGLFAYMTGKGQDAANSSMLIQNAYTALGKTDITSGISKLGVKVFDKTGTMRDIGSIFNELGAKLNGMSDRKRSSILENMGLKDMQAKNAFSILMSDSAKLTEALHATNNAAGETQTALAATNSPGRQWAEIMDKVDFTMTQIGYAIMPYVVEVMTWINEGFDTAVAYITDFYSKSLFLQDAVKYIGLGFQFVWSGVKLVWTWIAAAFEVTWSIVEVLYKFMKPAIMAIGDAFMWVYQNAIKPIIDAISWLMKKIQELAGMGDVEVKQKIEAVNKPSAASALDNIKLPGAAKDNHLAMPKDDKMSAGMNNISGGGSQQRTVIVNIGKLVESINTKSDGTREGTREAGVTILEELVRVVRGAEIAVSNG
jgi:TP901 family phage tail tape measure protein